MSDKRDQTFPDASSSPSGRQIVMEFESFRDFIDRISPVISEDGMFVDRSFLTSGMPRTGESVDFEVRLTDDFRLVHGRGEVVWIRESGSESGAAVRFEDLDEPGRRLVSRLITNYLKDGGAPFRLEVDGEPEGGGEMEPEPLDALEVEELFSGSSEGLETEPEELDSMTPPEAEPSVPDGIPEVDESADEVFPPPSPAGDGGRDPDERSGREDDTDETLELPVDIEAMDTDFPFAASGDDGPVILEDLGQYEDETSEVDDVMPVEMPSEEEREELAGTRSSSTVEGRSPWRTLLFASLAGILLGVAAWYFFDDQLRGLFRLDRDATVTAAAPSEGEDAETASTVAAEESAVPDAPQEESSQMGVSGVAVDGEGASEVGVGEVRDDASGRSVPPVTIVEEPAGGAEEEGDTGEVAAGPAASVEGRADAEVVSRPITRVEEITWSVADGGTEVTIVTDGSIAESSYDIVRIGEGAPRELIRIYGVSRPFTPRQLDVGSPQIERLRTGLHAEGTRGVLHIVADLAGPATEVTLVRTEGRRLIITFS